MVDHQKYMRHALSLAKEALNENEFPVGCVFVYGNEIIATGKRKNSVKNTNELDHGEIVALRELLQKDEVVDMNRVTVYASMEPCLMCYSTLILNGIRTIVYAYEDVMGGGTDLPLETLHPLYNKIQMNIVGGVLRKESLDLFTNFFKNPDQPYWKGSLLAEYTLKEGSK